VVSEQFGDIGVHCEVATCGFRLRVRWRKKVYYEVIDVTLGVMASIILFVRRFHD